MIAYCLKYNGKLWPHYIGMDVPEVKDQVHAHLGIVWTQLRKESKDYSIVKVEIVEVEE